MIAAAKPTKSSQIQSYRLKHFPTFNYYLDHFKAIVRKTYKERESCPAVPKFE